MQWRVFTDGAKVLEGFAPRISAALAGPLLFGVVPAHDRQQRRQMTRRIEKNVRCPKTGGEMVVTEDLGRRLKLIPPQVRDLEQGVAIDEFAAPSRLVLAGQDDHDVEIRRLRQLCVIGEPVRRAGSVRSAKP